MRTILPASVPALVVILDAVLADRLRSLGAEVHSEPAEAAGLPDNLVAVLHGSGKGPRTYLFTRLLMELGAMPP
jgi:hypothetical protein